MRNWPKVAFPVVAIGVVLAVQATSLSNAAPQAAVQQQVHYVILSAAHQIPPGKGTWMQAFVETGCTDKRVLLTLNEAASDRDYTIRQMSAAYRRMDGRDGVLITLMFYHPVPPVMDVHVTIMQEGTQRSGPIEKWQE